MTDIGINFGNAKPLPKADEFEEGTYTLQIETWEVKPPKKEESKGKGVNISIKFSITDGEDMPPVWHNLWVDFANPWGAKLFFEALLDTELGEGSEIPPLDDPDYWVGQKVNCALVHEPYENKAGKEMVKFAPAGPDAFTPAS